MPADSYCYSRLWSHCFWWCMFDFYFVQFCKIENGDVIFFFWFQNANQDNLFINYLSRIHRDDDFNFIMQGFTRLLNNPLVQTYLPNSTKKIQFHQELLVFFWKMCDYNKVHIENYRPKFFLCFKYLHEYLYYVFRNFYILFWKVAMFWTF